MSKKFNSKSSVYIFYLVRGDYSKTPNSLSARNYCLQEWTQMINEWTIVRMGCPSASNVKRILLQQQASISNVSSSQSLYGFSSGIITCSDSGEVYDVGWDYFWKTKKCIEISSHKMTLKITENISDSLLAKVLGVLCSCWMIQFVLNRFILFAIILIALWHKFPLFYNWLKTKMQSLCSRYSLSLFRSEKQPEYKVSVK